MMLWMRSKRSYLKPETIKVDIALTGVSLTMEKIHIIDNQEQTKVIPMSDLPTGYERSRSSPVLVSRKSETTTPEDSVICAQAQLAAESATQKVSLVIPVFNEEENLEELVQRCVLSCQKT